MIKLSIITACRNQPEAALFQARNYLKFPQEIISQTEMIIVNDCCPDFPALPQGIRVIKTASNTGWQNGYCRNLAVCYATGRVIYLTDIDHVLNWQDASNFFQAVTTMQDCYVMVFPRKKITGEALNQGCNIFAMQRQKFLDIGGYDNDYNGHYGYEDKDLRERLDKAGLKGIMSNLTLTVYPWGTKDANRDAARNKALYEQKQQARAAA